jgi:hypothetical protein
VPPKLDLDTSNLIPFELPRRGAALLDPSEQRGEQPLLLLDRCTQLLGQVEAERLLAFLNGVAEESFVAFEVQVGQAIARIVATGGRRTGPTR